MEFIHELKKSKHIIDPIYNQNHKKWEPHHTNQIIPNLPLFPNPSYQKNTRYLGMFIDKNGTFKTHFEKRTKQIYFELQNIKNLVRS